MTVTDRTDSTPATSAGDPDRIESVEATPRDLWRRYGTWVVVLLNLSGFFLLWELFARFEIINPLFLPRATAMFEALWDGLTTTAPPGAVVSGSIRDHLFYSLSNLGVGMVIAIVIGVPFGLLMGANRYVDALLSPYVWAISSMPRIALVPLFILFLGFTRKMQITIIVLSAVFPIMINAWAGVKTTDKSLLAAAKVFGAKRLQLYSKVVLPFTLPFIIVGIQQGIGRGLVGVIIAEIFGGSKGLGYLIQRSADTFNSALLYAVLFLLVVVSLSLIQFTRWLEARAAPWRRLERL
ncbi:MAG: ABC transporter permease [Acidimicrobiales bacterium]